MQSSALIKKIKPTKNDQVELSNYSLLKYFELNTCFHVFRIVNLHHFIFDKQNLLFTFLKIAL